MRSFFERWTGRLPLQFRVLYRQFLLRVIDLESLSIEADIPKLLGQFAGILILISVLQTVGFLFVAGVPQFQHMSPIALVMHTAHGFFSGTMLVGGLLAVISWDSIFPDRRDAMVLGPLPVRPRTILLAKTAASGTLLAIGIVALNCGMGIALPMVFSGGGLRFLLVFAAYWFTTAASAVAVFSTVLTVQGFTALLLPRRFFLRLSALLQMAFFALFIVGFFLEPSADVPGLIEPAATQGVLNAWPSYWFLALFLRLTGSLPAVLAPLALRAMLSVTATVLAAGVALLLCYWRTMRRIVEEPDLMPGAGGLRLPLPLGSQITRAIVLFSLRALARSKQHRVVYAFFLSIAFAVAVSTLRSALAGGSHQPLNAGFLVATQVMLCLSVVGLRSIVVLPVSLRANWVLQITQLVPPEKYIGAARWAFLILSVLPVWLLAAALSLFYRPLSHAAEHLVVLALLGWLLVELCMIGISKIPFACSYLPGKSNIQYMFWACAVVYLPLAISFSNYEESTLGQLSRYVGLIAGIALASAVFSLVNRRRARSAVLNYEEQEAEMITSLGIGTIFQPLADDPAPRSSV